MCFVNAGCGSGVLLTSRGGDRVSFVTGTQRFRYWFPKHPFLFHGLSSCQRTLWHWMLTEGLTWGGNWWLPETWSLPGWTHRPFTSMVTKTCGVFALSLCPAQLQRWGLFSSFTADGEISRSCWNSKLEELYGNDAITFSYSFKASLCKSLSGRHRIE